MNFMRERQTIPAGLEEWLRGIQSGLQQQAWPKEIKDYRGEGAEAKEGSGAPKSLTDSVECDNVQVSIGI